jgi:signal transduction histidine kinase
MRRPKLQWKIFLYLLGFCVLLLGFLWMFQTVFLSDTYKFVRKLEIARAIALVEKNINSPDLESILLELEAAKAITVRPTQSFAPPPLPTPPAPGGWGRRPETITRVHEYTLKDGRTISLTFYAMITPVDSTVTTLQLQLLIITVIMILAAVLLAVIISKRIAKPIEQINLSAKALARGDYDTEFRGTGYLEIEELSDTLNTAAEELSKVERLRRELIANVSHDLRTPLTFIYSYAEMMHDFPDEVTPEQSQIIMDEAKRLNALVSDMLDISLLEAGAVKLNKEWYNLTESLRDTINRMNELFKKEGYRVEFEYAEDVLVLADEVKITQAVYNLLLNAINHSGVDKGVLVRQIKQAGCVRIEVTDRGPGIKSSDLPHIWERYFKVDHKHKRPMLGTGLGLSIVRKVIDLHGGGCGVESEEGKGSTFWFELELS